MKGLDIFLAVAALVGLGLFLGVLVWKVPAPALILVCLAGIGMAAYDFFLTLRGDRRSS